MGDRLVGVLAKFIIRCAAFSHFNNYDENMILIIYGELSMCEP